MEEQRIEPKGDEQDLEEDPEIEEQDLEENTNHAEQGQKEDTDPAELVRFNHLLCKIYSIETDIHTAIYVMLNSNKYC